MHCGSIKCIYIAESIQCQHRKQHCLHQNAVCIADNCVIHYRIVSDLEKPTVMGSFVLLFYVDPLGLGPIMLHQPLPPHAHFG